MPGCTHIWHEKLDSSSVLIFRFCSECNELEMYADDGWVGFLKINATEDLS